MPAFMHVHGFRGLANQQHFLFDCGSLVTVLKKGLTSARGLESRAVGIGAQGSSWDSQECRAE